MIADLEHLFGVRLLDRGRNGVQLTVYGNALLKRSLAAFDELNQSARDIEFLSNPAKGDVKLRCQEAYAPMLLPQLIHRFSASYPRVVLHVDHMVTTGMALPALRSRECDLLLGRPPLLPLTDADVNVEPLFDDPLVVTAGAQNRLAPRRKIDLAELVDEPWILPPAHGGNYLLLNEAFQARGLNMPKTNLVTLSRPVIFDFLTNGPFISALPRSQVIHNSLRMLAVDLPIRPWPIAVMTLKGRTLTPVVERFIACARDVLKSISDRPRAPRP